MPNTLAHISAHSLLTRSVLQDADPKWIYLGCVIPDLPWILQRIVLLIVPETNYITLRYYVDIQASLFGCLILCAALAILSERSRYIFILLGFNSLLHLLLDACQTKWANGVHLGAPFTWELTNWGFFWPESLPTYILTGAGLVFVGLQWQQGVRRSPELRRVTRLRLGASMTAMIMYFTLPFFFLQGPEKANNHYIATFNNPQGRAGRYAEFDRARCKPAGSFLNCFNSEEIRVTGVTIERPAVISLRGTFVTDNEFKVSESHIHLRGFRNNASYLGLALIFLLWIISLIRHVRSSPGEAVKNVRQG